MAMAMAMAMGDDPVRQLIEMGEGACLIGEGIQGGGRKGQLVGWCWRRVSTWRSESLIAL